MSKRISKKKNQKRIYHSAAIYNYTPYNLYVASNKIKPLSKRIDLDELVDLKPIKPQNK
jgi:hypothetical protein